MSVNLKKKTILDRRTGRQYECPADLILRPARLEDQEEFYRMSRDSDIYDGEDYLPGMLPDFLKSPNRFVYVGEIHGKIVCAGFFYLLDGGRTLMGGGARVEEHLRHQGIWKAMSTYGIESIMEIFGPSRTSRVKQFRSTSGNVDLMLKRIKEGKATEIMRQNYIPVTNREDISKMLHHLNASTMESCVSKYPMEGTRQCFRAELKEIFENQQYCKSLFPHGVVNIFKEPFLPIEENLDEIFRGGRPCLVKECSLRKNYKSLSFGSPIPSSWPKGLRYDVDYYGSLEVAEVIAHVLKHLAFIPKFHKEGPISMVVMAPAEIDHTQIERELKQLGFDNKGVPYEPCIVVQSDYDTSGYEYLFNDSKL